jgi:hypothetical protein
MSLAARIGSLDFAMSPIITKCFLGEKYFQRAATQEYHGTENSIESFWVVTEIRNAGKGEISGKRRKLFPIRPCDFDTLCRWECFDADFGADLANEVRPVLHSRLFDLEKP